MQKRFHRVAAFIEYPPVIGQIVSIFEMTVAWLVATLSAFFTSRAPETINPAPPLPKNPPPPDNEYSTSSSPPLSQAGNSSSSSVSRPTQMEASPEVIAEIAEKVESLRTNYNELKTLSSPEGERLIRELREFADSYEKYRIQNPNPFDAAPLEKSFNCFDHIQANTKGMQSSLEFWNIYYKPGSLQDSHGILQMPQDGNCWLHTSIAGLKLICPKYEDLTVESLRKEVLEWMQDNYQKDEALQDFLEHAVLNYRLSKQEKLNGKIANLEVIQENLGWFAGNERQHNLEKLEKYRRSLVDLDAFDLPAYFAHAAKNGSYGGHAEFYAISRLYQVNIAVWRTLPPHKDLPPRLTRAHDIQIEHPDAEYTIHAVLSLEGNHFNLRGPGFESEEGQSSESALK